MYPKRAADDKETKAVSSYTRLYFINCFKMLCLMHFVANTKNEALLGENGLLY